MAHAFQALLAASVILWLSQRNLRWLPFAQYLQVFVPIGFGVGTVLVWIAGARLPHQARLAALGLDLVGWSTVPGVVAAVSLAPQWYGAWLTLATGTKVAVGLWVVLQRAGSLRDGGTALLLSALFLLCALLQLPYTRYGVPGNMGLSGDEPHYLAIAANFLHHGDFLVGRAYRDGTVLQIYGSVGPPSGWPLSRTATGLNGPAHDLGLPLLAAPFYGFGETFGHLGGIFAVLIAMAFAGAVTVREMYLLLRAVPVQPRLATMVTIVAAFSVPFLPYATQIFAEMPIACCVALIARRLFQSRRSSWDLAIVSAALALMPWLHLRAWAVLLPLLAGAVLTWRGSVARFVPVASVAVSAAIYWTVLFKTFGRFILSPVMGVAFQQHRPPLTPTNVLVAMENPLLEKQAGLLFYGPIWVLAFAGLVLVARRSIAGLSTAAAIPLYLLFSGVGTTLGNGPAWSPPARYSVLLIPLLIAPLAVALERARHQWWTVLLWPALAWGALCLFLVQADRAASYAPGIIVALARMTGTPSPIFLTRGSAPWLALLGLIVVVVLLAFATGGLALPRRVRANDKVPAVRP